jgi:hypothetical protein
MLAVISPTTFGPPSELASARKMVGPAASRRRA